MVFLQGVIQGPRLLLSCGSIITTTWIPSCSRDYLHPHQLEGEGAERFALEMFSWPGLQMICWTQAKDCFFWNVATSNFKGMLRNMLPPGRWEERLGDKPAVSCTCIAFLRDGQLNCIWFPATKNNAAVNILFLMCCGPVMSLVHKFRYGFLGHRTYTCSFWPSSVSVTLDWQHQCGPTSCV